MAKRLALTLITLSDNACLEKALRWECFFVDKNGGIC